MDTINVDWQNVSPFIIEGNRKVQNYELYSLTNRKDCPYDRKHRLCCYCVSKVCGQVKVRPRSPSYYKGTMEANYCSEGGFTIQTNGTCDKFQIKDEYKF